MLAMRACCVLPLMSVAALSAGSVAVAHATSPQDRALSARGTAPCVQQLKSGKSRGVSLTDVTEPGVSPTGVSLTHCAGSGVSLT